MTKANEFVTANFKNVGTEVIDLTTIKVVGYTGAATDNASVQFLDAAGNVKTDGAGKRMVYYWRDSDGVNGKWIKKDGRNIVAVAEGEVTIAPGAGLWCQKNADGLSFQFSGEVILSSKDVYLTLANQGVGNMMAVPLDLTKIKVSGYSGSTTDQVTIQFLDEAGNVRTDGAGKRMVYYWRDSDGSSGKWIKKDGRNIVDLAEGSVILQPGEGAWAQNNDTATGYKLVFPAPQL